MEWLLTTIYCGMIAWGVSAVFLAFTSLPSSVVLVISILLGVLSVWLFHYPATMTPVAFLMGVLGAYAYPTSREHRVHNMAV